MGRHRQNLYYNEWHRSAQVAIAAGEWSIDDDYS
jgi:hypothetical protein